MNRAWRIVGGFLLLVLLVLVRHFEYRWFFDPFMGFFQRTVEAGEPMPLQWYLNLALRFLLNTALSLGILYLCFLNRNVVKFAAILYGLLFVLLFPVFVLLMQTVNFDNYLPVFYVRRFLAHPVLLLLLIPAFFYQRIRAKR